MMRYFFSLFVVLFICSCNLVPNRSIFEPLTTDELAAIIKRDSLFVDFYEAQEDAREQLGDIDKARYKDITYRDLYKMIQYSRDTIVWKSLSEKWDVEWNLQFGECQNKVDSVLNYWRLYKENNSLDKYIKVEFAVIDKEYYSYSSDVKNVNLGFRLTPAQGTVDQVRFSYRYSAKINDFYGEKHNCILTSPFCGPIIRYWEVDYSDEKNLKGETTSSFLRDYDVEIEVTNVRKDGINYSINDLDIPQSVAQVFDTDSLKYPSLYAVYKDDVIKSLLQSDYLPQYKYNEQKIKQILMDKFPAEFAYMEYLSKK